MTGHGDASGQNDRVSLTAEVRSVNNRHLKVSVRCPDAFLSLESRIDKLIRQSIGRGTVSVWLKVKQLNDQRASIIDETAVRQYWEQVNGIAADLGVSPPSEISPLLSLPGIIEEPSNKSVEETDWPLFEQVIQQAIENLQQFRIEEGQQMADDLASLSGIIATNADVIAARAPQVVLDYRDRLKSRINDLLESTTVKLDDNDLIREVSLFADRCDINEELTRLKSHLQQYKTLLKVREPSGRKLEFLGQEMFREINTIGSKANDIDISHRVVEMKAALEKMREMIQNVE